MSCSLRRVKNIGNGAAPETAVIHSAIQETLADKAVEWLEHVSDEQYQTGD